MPIRAVCFRSLPCSVNRGSDSTDCVFPVSYRLQVIRIYAQAISTEVVKFKAGWN